MNIIEELNLSVYINAHDTYTVYGSRLSDNVINGMKEISKSFVEMKELQNKLGEKIAVLTKNNAAYVSNGSSGAVLLCACVCMTKGDMFKYRKLPDTNSIQNEIIVMKCQRNAYDKSISTSGAKVIEIGDSDETLEYDLIGSINEKTAGLFYFASDLYKRGSLSLERTIEICKQYGVPVVVDAAAFVPPIENFWNFTAMGADMVIFSGGKTLKGPMDAGVIVGKKKYIEKCKSLGFPNHGICRSNKTSKEAMVGMYIAITEFFDVDKEQYNQKHYDILDRVISHISKISCKYFIDPLGSIGQDYPRLFITVSNVETALNIKAEMKNRKIYIGTFENKVYISPVNLTFEEADIVGKNLADCLS